MAPCGAHETSMPIPADRISSATLSVIWENGEAQLKTCGDCRITELCGLMYGEATYEWDALLDEYVQEDPHFL